MRSGNINRKNTRSQFIKVPKALLTEPLYSSLGSDGILLYSLILDRAQLSKHNELFIDEHSEVFVYFTIDEICRTFGCSHDKSTALMRRLEQSKLIKIQRQGMGKPHKIYPLEDECSTEKTAVLNAKNQQSGVRKIRSHGCDFSACNNTYNNKTYFIQSDSAGSGSGKNTVPEWVKRLEQEKAEPEPHTKYSFNNGSIAERARKLSQEQDNRG